MKAKLLAILKRMHAGETNDQLSMCYNVVRLADTTSDKVYFKLLLTTYFKTWISFSGSETYPVPMTDELQVHAMSQGWQNAGLQYWHSEKQGKLGKGEQRLLRIDLLEHIIRELEHESD